ncbi:Hypothetical predicted protein, partial [Olea europaea subsp. europaea]
QMTAKALEAAGFLARFLKLNIILKDGDINNTFICHTATIINQQQLMTRLWL